MVEYLEVTGLCPIKEYIHRRQATIAEYTTNHPIHELYTGAERIMVSRRFMRWWDQDLSQEEEGNGASEGEEREVG